MNLNETTTCLSCQKPLRGRTDKKFCNDYCRNGFHNKEKADKSALALRVNSRLQKNRRILHSICNSKNGLICINKEYLLEQGFSFRYFTHIRKDTRGSVYRYCYEYGYLETEKGKILLIGEEEPTCLSV
jgi:hypothetical protein